MGKDRISHELALSQRAFFWQGDDKVVITPYLIPSTLMEVNKRALGLRNVVNLAPAKRGINLCSLVIEDKGLMRRICKEIRKNHSVTVSPYAVTQDFLQLVARLKGLGLDFTVPEKPANESLWTVPYLDSKVGFRAEMLKLRSEYKNVKIPEGFVAMDATEAQQMMGWFYTRNRSSVIKANFGESGWGVKILRREDYLSFLAFQKAVAKILKSDVIWQNTSIVIEEFIDPDTKVAGGFPSTETLVTDHGASFTYHCGQVLNNAGIFFGVEIGKCVFSDSLSEKLLTIANAIGKRYWELGYRGYFDTDFIVSKTGEIYVSETNTRKTGGTHVYDVARNLFGKGYETEAYLLSYDSSLYGRKKIEPSKLLEKLGHVLYPMEGQKKGAIVTLISEWKPVLGYIVVASNRSEGQKLQQQLLSIFGK